MTDAPTLQALDRAVQDHHNSVRDHDEPPMVVGWVVAYIAVDGDGAESLSYAVGEGTTAVTAIGLAEWARDAILNPPDDD